ncbi:uncharacterized protein LOC116213711 isoform X2 [Punica granatum]|uniref:Uncharacterized protein LOC116213711 isoform X2 n=1 Tax=Punica granatum TaxID=22663 RepID=A0A6P8EGR3_PUNGR|nr:uncharacterized protein LOC116213711 isoform X2 [Punica granatum]
MWPVPTHVASPAPEADGSSSSSPQFFCKERQEEVDQLLNKTRIEMHAPVQAGGRSPKPVNGPASTSQIKPGSDCVHSTSSFPSQNKGKKRDCGDQGSEPVKRERSSRFEDGDPGYARSENPLKSKIAKITEKGGLVDSEGVDKIVQLMMPERNDKRVELASRSLLAGVIAATEKFDCLSRFVQLRGLPVLDEWLQEAHRGKIGEGGGIRASDKAIEEFLLVLLRALDKLPVNLQSLQMCNIGKSVNHLRTHKNLEIQKKARSLVDTWKKRVEAEMSMNDARSASNQAVPWSGKSRVSEVSHARGRHSGGTTETTPESSTSQISASKTASGKPVQGETAESAAASPGAVKSVPSPGSLGANLRDSHPRNAGVSSSDLTLTASRDEKSTSSSQSHNNSQSCSSDHAKTRGILGKDDAGSSTAVSNKISGGSTRQRKSINGIHKQSGSSRNATLHKSEKVPQSGLPCEKAVDAPAEVSGQKLIVKIPNRGHCPVHNASGGLFEDHSIMNSRASSPVTPEMSNQCDRNTKEKTEACGANISSGVNTESWQSNDLIHMPPGSDVGDGSLGVVPDELGSGEDTKRSAVAAQDVSSPPLNELNSEKLHEASLSSINALIDSCVKLSETLRDDGGMNLLASVAAGEILSSDWVPRTDFPPGNTSAAGHSSAGEVSLVKSSPHDGYQDRSKSSDNLIRYLEKAGPDGGIAKKDGDEHPNGSCRELQQISEQFNGTKLSTIGADNIIEDAKVRKAVPEAYSKVDKEDKTDTSEVSGGGDLTHQNPTPLMFSRETTEKDFVVETVAAKSEKPDEVGRNRFNQVKQETNASKSPGFQAEAGSDTISHNRGEIKENDESKGVCEDHVASAKSERCKFTGSEADECVSNAATNTSLSAAGSSSRNVKVKFDLNEGINADDAKCGDATNLAEPCFPAAVPLSDSLVYPAIPASVTVTAAVKGPFVPPNDLLRIKGELGWKGSAATSAFRPAESNRKALEMPLDPMDSSHPPDASTLGKQNRAPLDFDLNVADEGILDDVAPQDSALEVDTLLSSRSSCINGGVTASASTRSGGLALDLNQVGEAAEIGSSSIANGHWPDVMVGPAKSSGSLLQREGVGVRRDFDLNDGPAVDDASAEPLTSSQHVRSSMCPQQSTPGLRMNTDPGNLSTWYSPAGTYSAMAVPSVLSSIATGGPPRMVGPSSFSPDVFQRPVLPSPAVPFASTFQYPVFPFGASFPLPSVTPSGSSTMYMDPLSGGRLSYPPTNSHMLGPAGAVSNHYPRPHVVRLDSSNNGGFDRKWGRQGLDLNAGPGGLDLEAKDEFSLLVPGQISAFSSQPIGRSN